MISEALPAAANPTATYIPPPYVTPCHVASNDAMVPVAHAIPLVLVMTRVSGSGALLADRDELATTERQGSPTQRQPESQKTWRLPTSIHPNWS